VARAVLWSGAIGSVSCATLGGQIVLASQRDGRSACCAPALAPPVQAGPSPSRVATCAPPYDRDSSSDGKLRRHGQPCCDVAAG